MAAPRKPAPPPGWAAFARLARCAALDDGPGVHAALRALPHDPDCVLAALRRHHLAELAVHALRADATAEAIAEELSAGLAAARRAPPVAAQVLLQAFAEAQATLAAAGVPVLLVKGAVLADRVYGGLDRRPQYDVDVLVPRRRLRRARRSLTALGYVATGRDQHAVELRRDGVKVDVHWALRSAPAYAIDAGAVWRDAVPVHVGEVRARTLSDEHLLTLLCVGAVEDLGLGMLKLKQLCDLWLLARELDASFDWDAWLAARAAEHLDGLAVNGCALVLALLGAGDELPNLRAAVGRRAAAVRIRDAEHAASLVAAPRHAAANMAWFAQVYPGRVLAFRAHSLLAGFPGSLRDVQVDRYLPRMRDR